MTTILKPKKRMLSPLRPLLVLLCACCITATATAQRSTVTLSGASLTKRQAISEVETQTGYIVAYDNREFNVAPTVRFDQTATTVSDVLGKIVSGTGHAYIIDGKYIIIHRTAAIAAAAAGTTPATRRLTGYITDSDSGQPIEGATVEIMSGKYTLPTVQTDAAGKFVFPGVPEGRYVVKVASPDGSANRYREITITQNQVSNISLNFDAPVAAPATTPPGSAATAPAVTVADKTEGLMLSAPAIAAEAVPVQTTVSEPAEPVYYGTGLVRGKTVEEHAFVPESKLYRDYHTKMALKTNFIYWGAGAINLGFEFYLGRKWTFELAGAWSPWQKSESQSRQLWFVQPEVRYWFCNAFEGHFLGLHGIYGQYNLGNIDLGFAKVFEGVDYQGYGYGAGLAYGYHLPLSNRWSLEFTVGAGWIHLDYDKYNCVGCRQLVGRETKNYFGLTKAGISLVYIIK